MEPANGHMDPDFRKGDDAVERTELQRLAPTLFSIPKEEPFRIPAHFFDQLPHTVQAKLVERQRRPSFPWVWRVAIAAPVVAALIGAWWFFRDRPDTGDAPMAATSVPIDILDADVITEEDLLAEIASDESIGLDAIGSELTDEEVLFYLESENTDLNEIISEL